MKLPLLIVASLALSVPAFAAEKGAEKAPEKTFPTPPPPKVAPALTMNVWPGLPPGDKAGMPPSPYCTMLAALRP